MVSCLFRLFPSFSSLCLVAGVRLNLYNQQYSFAAWGSTVCFDAVFSFHIVVVVGRFGSSLVLTKEEEEGVAIPEGLWFNGSNELLLGRQATVIEDLQA